MHHLRRAENLRVFTLVLCSHPTHGGGGPSFTAAALRFCHYHSLTLHSDVLTHSLHAIVSSLSQVQLWTG